MTTPVRRSACTASSTGVQSSPVSMLSSRPMPPRSTNVSTDSRLAELREAGMTITQPAEQFNLSPRSVIERLSRLMKQPRSKGAGWRG